MRKDKLVIKRGILTEAFYPSFAQSENVVHVYDEDIVTMQQTFCLDEEYTIYEF